MIWPFRKPNPGRELALIGARHRKVSREQLRRETTDALRAKLGLPAWPWRAM
jgi:hypothetical protein